MERQQRDGLNTVKETRKETRNYTKEGRKQGDSKLAAKACRHRKKKIGKSRNLPLAAIINNRT